MADPILDVDLLAFETGDATRRAAVVDGVMRSLQTGFVYTGHDLSEDLLDTAYAMLAEFFALDSETKARYTAPGTNGQRGYTGLLVETAAVADVPDWKEMLNWGRQLPAGHPLRVRYPYRYADLVLPEDILPGITELLTTFYERVFDLQVRFMRIIAVGLGCAPDYFDKMLPDGATLTRAIHYPAMDLAPDADHVWAGEHGDINLITALPRASAKGLQVKLDDGSWVDAVAPSGQVIMNSGMMLEHLTNGRIPPGIHRVVADPEDHGDRYSVVQFCHPTPWTILSPVPSTVTPENPLRYPAIAAADKLDQVLYDINLIEDGRRVD